jgi:hypothetical protein
MGNFEMFDGLAYVPHEEDPTHTVAVVGRSLGPR